MKNKIVIGVVLFVLVIGGGFLFVNKKSQTSSPSVQIKTEPTQQAQSTNSISIENFAFNPDTLTVKQGTTVTWMNKDSAPHKIKSDTFNSVALNQGDKFEFTFNSKGNFDYSCSIHPSMQGKIVVE